MDLGDVRIDIPTLDDVVAIHRIYSDPRVWTHLPSGRHAAMEETEQMVRQWIAGWDRDGLSSWIVRDSTNSEVLGHAGCSLRRDTFWNLGYRLAYEAHGRGIATVVSTCAVEEARKVRPELPVVAYLLEHNRASAHVAEKAGLTLQHRGFDAGNPDPNAIRLVYTDRPLTATELEAAMA